MIPEDEDELALTMCKKKRKITRKDFLSFAEEIGIEKIAAEKMLAMLINKKETLLAMCSESYLSETLKERLKTIISARIEILGESNVV